MDSSEDGPSGAVKIIRRSGKLMWNNRKPLIIILLSFLLPQFALFHAYMINIGNLGLKLAEIFAMARSVDPAIIPGLLLQSLRTFVLPSLVIRAASFLLSSLLSLAVIYTANAGFKGRKITLKSLLNEIREKLKGVVVTQLYVLFLSLGYMSFSLSLILAVFLFGELSVGFYFLASFIGISFYFLLFYLDFVWFQGVVVSITEAGYEGLTALGKSTAAVRGRRALAFRLNFLLILLAVIIGFLRSPMSKLVPGEKGFVVVDFVVSGMTSLMAVFTLVVHALFYEECRSKPIVELDTTEKLLYNKVSSTVPRAEIEIP